MTLLRYLLPPVLAFLVLAVAPSHSFQDPPARPAPATPRLVLAPYIYDVQNDPGRRAAYRPLWEPGEASPLAHHPWESPGPWFSGARAAWHRHQLRAMTDAGIDVALAVYRPGGEPGADLSRPGLQALGQALKELRGDGLEPYTRPRGYPQIGLALDIDALARAAGGPVDLTQEAAQRSLYGMIRDFYLQIPPEFHATLQLPLDRLPERPGAAASHSGGTAYLVRLFNDAAVREADNSFLAECERRFQEEFGAGIVWLGTPGLFEKADGLDAVAPHHATGPAELTEGDWISTMLVSPGEDSLLSGEDGRLRGRDNGDTYVGDWQRVNEAAPDWVLIDSWNDYARGTEVAPTLEYGLFYGDRTRARGAQFKAAAPYSARIVRATVPRVMQPQVVYQVDVTVENTGFGDWEPVHAVAVSYRWLQDGERVGDPSDAPSPVPAVPLTLRRGEARSQIIGIAAPLKDGRPLPGGDYVLEIGALRRIGFNPPQDEWFDTAAAGKHLVPVRVETAPEAPHPFWVSGTAPAVARGGAAYPARVRLRNDGSRPWRENRYAVGARWLRLGGAEETRAVVAEIPRVPLPAEVHPGREISVAVEVPTEDAEGRPLPIPRADEDWYYVLEWDLWDGEAWASEQGGATRREAVAIVDRDPAPHFLGASLPSDMVAGRPVPVNIGLRNNGPETYRKDRDEIAIHWYYLDGSELDGARQTVPLPEDVPPFSKVEVEVPVGPLDSRGRPRQTARELQVQDLVIREIEVEPPAYFGPLYCVIDLVHNGEPTSTAPAGKGNDLFVALVNIYSPAMTPQPLSAHANVDGITQDGNRSNGDLDGRGNTLPGELMPPYIPRPAGAPDRAPNPLYPCGIWVRPVSADRPCPRVTFMYPQKFGQAANMVAASGQRLEFGPAPRISVHLLALATAEDAEGEFRLFYADGSTETKPLKFTYFLDEPQHGEHVALRLTHRHTRVGDDPDTRTYLYHYELVADRQKQLVGLELPDNPAIKIVALTLENAPQAAGS